MVGLISRRGSADVTHSNHGCGTRRRAANASFSRAYLEETPTPKGANVVSSTATKRKRPGGAPVGLNREAILQAASRFELDELQMAEVAKVLGVSKPAIYHYFPSKQELIRALGVEALRGVQLRAVGNRSWRDLLTEAAHATHDLYLAHPEYLTVLTAGGTAAATHIVERMLVALSAAGCDEAKAVRTMELISAWCSYSATQTQFFKSHELTDAARFAHSFDEAQIRPESPVRALTGYYAEHSRAELFEGTLQHLLDAVAP